MERVVLQKKICEITVLVVKNLKVSKMRKSKKTVVVLNKKTLIFRRIIVYDVQIDRNEDGYCQIRSFRKIV